MIDNLIEIPLDKLLTEVQDMVYNGYRFVTATCVDNSDGSYDIIYHFDKNLQMKNYKLKITKDQEVPSISKIYFCAILVENEMKELFGVKINDIAIDYGGHMLLTDDVMFSPMGKRHQITVVQKGEENNA